tara:strand:- start:1316 stop:1771 length:456 start_codon:yes stop_codon:yes gene_type:complete
MVIIDCNLSVKIITYDKDKLMNLIDLHKSERMMLWKNLLSYLLIVFLITIVFISRVNASSDLSSMNNSQFKIADKYAEKYCIAKEENLFEGLRNEKVLKDTYFRYIGLQTTDIFANDIYKILINKINEKCKIEDEEKSELLEFLKKESKSN